jgi:hypothetical protein
VLVLPQLGAGGGIEREDARVGRRHEHLAVVDQRLRLLTALLLAAEGEGPGRHQPGRIAHVDLLERRMALALRAQAPGQHFLAGLGRGLDHLLGHGCLGTAEGHEQQGGKRSELHGVSPLLMGVRRRCERRG